MKTPLILLLTNDPGLEEAVAEVLGEIGGLSHLARNPEDALELVCTISQDLDLAVIDFGLGLHGLTLLSAISSCREDLPVIVITHDDEKHLEALAYATGATACLHKPVLVRQLAAAIKQYRRSEHQLALVA